jgi:hypothetical protein
MLKDTDIDFLSIIRDVFSPALIEYGFSLKDGMNWDGQGEDTVSVVKDQIEITFYVGHSKLFYYCSAGIKLSGALGEKASSNPSYRAMGISALAKGIDPDYKSNSRAAQSAEEVKQAFEAERDDMVKYCKDILLGDVSSWTPIANKMAEECENRNKK